MIIDEKVAKVERSEDFKETAFKIEGSAKAFEILSSGLYTDIILAIVRELSTNAWDSHVEAGNINEKFLVHLPNSMEPFFSIRDYGTGLSQESVEELYTTYFRSNKTKSNSLNGCLGLGSKSPFAYTDSFQVISYFNGTKYVYNLFKAEAGFPKVALLTIQDTDEVNGLEIIIAVKKEDFSKFCEKANRLYPYFTLPPKVIGNTAGYKKELEEPVMEGTFWKLMKPQNYYHNTGSKAVMGNIAYPLGRNYLSIDSEHRYLIGDNEFIINFSIGDLEITANREELQWNDKTKAALEKAVELLSKEIKEQIEKEFKDCETLWEARVKFSKLFGYNGVLRNLSSALGTGNLPQWRGKEVSDSIELKNSDYAVNLLQVDKAGVRLRCYTDKNVRFIKVTENTKFIYDDLEKGGRLRAGAWLKQQSDATKLVAIFLTNETTATDRNKITNLLGITKDMWVKTSSLAKIKRKKYAPTKKSNKTIVFKWKNTSSWGRDPERFWEEEEVDPTSFNGVYVPIKRWKIVTDAKGDVVRAPSDISRLYQQLTIMGMAPDEIYGIKYGSVNKVKKVNPKWKTLFDYAEEKYNEYVKKHNLKNSIKNKDAYQQLEFVDVIKETNKCLMRDYPSLKGCEFNKLAEAIYKSEKGFSDELKYAFQLRGFLHSPKKNDKDTKISGILYRENEIIENYPLLKSILKPNGYRSFYMRDFNMKDFAKYIYLVEMENK